MARKRQDFEAWDGNGFNEPFDVALDLSGYTATWVAKDMLDAGASPFTVTKSASVGAYSAGTGITTVTVTVAPADFNGHPGTYKHELVVTSGGIPLTVAEGKLYVHASLVT